jgi:hypothetical protein
MKDHKGMRPQDVVVLLAIISIQRKDWDRKSSLKIIHKQPYPQNKDLAELLKISTAEISASLYRSAYAGLIDINSNREVFKLALLDFIQFGLKYVFPVQVGALTRGVPTAHSAEPLKSKLSFQEETVWEHPEGSVRGQSILPLYSTVPDIAHKNKLLYELLALTDSLRIGGARERELAIEELKRRFSNDL